MLSALGRLARAGDVEASLVEPILQHPARTPFVRHTLQPLLVAARGLRHSLPLRDAIQGALARRLGAVLLTADARLAEAPVLGGAVTLAVR
jgi:predicted nucleic acid-binding protein